VTNQRRNRGGGRHLASRVRPGASTLAVDTLAM
jgi:hypothetical protein